MSQFPKQAHVVIIGAGIVGNSVAGHLAEKGWKDMVMVDKGPLPNPGGSTGHACNFIFPVDHGKLMTQLTVDSVRQYRDQRVLRTCGGIELARTEERLTELKRRVASAKCWGVEAELLDPRGVVKLFPWVNREKILGGFYTPSVSVVNSLGAGTIFREKALEMGALVVFPDTEVTGIDVEDGRVRSVITTRGEIAAEYVIIACGVWSPRIAELAGAAIPLVPVVHQMIDIGPIPQFTNPKGEIEYPILRDMSVLMYERQAAANMQIGSYAHRPILHDPNDIPSIDQAKLSPTEMPFTREDFEPQLQKALELLPDMLDNDQVKIRYAVNGLISLTPDGAPVIGETPGVKGLWSAAAVWIKEAPGVGRMVAEWMTGGAPELDPNEVDIARFYPFARTKTHVWDRAREGFNKIYGIVHPQEQWESSRIIRLSPFHERTRSLGAVYFQTAGWERPHWYESNEALLEEYGDRVNDRPNEWDARWWSLIINAEHLAMRERVALVDLSAFAIFDICGPGALDTVQRVAVSQMDLTVGKAVYTLLLNVHGGIRRDVVIVRTGKHSFRVTTGAGHGGVDKKLFADNLPEDGSAQLHDQTSALCTVGVWGPSARDLVASVTEDDVSNAGFPYATSKKLRIREIPVRALRISYVGELGWEIYTAVEHGQKLWDILWDLRHHRPSGKGLSSLRQRSGYRVQSGGSRHGPAAGQAPGLHRQGGLPEGSADGSSCCLVHSDRG
jgi:glycine/D-amino acid oxidase-like deaminating enzyme/glycine cleavage system aminomethyltransferase T